MTGTQSDFQAIFDELLMLSPKENALFLELLLFCFTISARGIWSDEQFSDKDKAAAFRWLNELNHRIWNIRTDLNDGMDKDCIFRLYENLKFYGEQSTLLQAHFVPTLFLARERFKKINRTD